MKKVMYVLTCVIILSSLVSCGGSSSSSGGDSLTGTVYSADGTEATSIEAAEPVSATLAGLTASTRYQVDVVNPDGTAICSSSVYTDANGNIPQSQYCFLRDQDYENSGRVDAMVIDNKNAPIASFISPTKAISTGDYTLTVYNTAGDEVGTVSFAVTSTEATVCASNSSGSCARSFLQTTSNVYATIEQGTGVSDGASVDIYVVSDRCNTGYTVGDQLVDVTGGADTVTVSYASGTYTTSTPVWATPANTGTYDIVVDVDQSGTYTAGDIIEINDYAGIGSICAPGLTIQEAYSEATGLVMQIAMDANRAYQDVFSTNSADENYSDIWAQVQSRRRLGHSLQVRKYIVAHQDAWVGGEQLVDVIPPTIDQVQTGCTNQQRRMIGPIGLMSNGCYDVVFDVDADGIYDLGSDAVDNIDLNSAATCGFIVAGDTSTLAITITGITDADGESVAAGTSSADSSTVAVAGEVTGVDTDLGATVYAYVVKGTQQSSLVSTSLAADGSYTLSSLPLFSGANSVVVYVTQNTGSDMIIAQATSTVTWNPSGVSGDIDIHAHISWTDSTDMDTHLVKPGGTFTGSGDSSNYSDCHWNNECNISGTDIGLDWSVLVGQVAVDASQGYVAKLDRDCVRCDDKYENVWIKSADEVAPTTGSYLLCIDAYSGTDTPTAVVSIAGVEVANFTAPSTITSTDDDLNTWYVGYVNWVGTTGVWVTVNTIGPDTICTP